MGNVSLEQRHSIESVFHDQWATATDLSQLLVQESFEAITAVENRYILGRFGELEGKQLLDVGCGMGEAAVFFAMRRAQVVACDISARSLQRAQELAAHHQVKIHTVRLAAEGLPFPDGSFDFMYGNGVLHHVDFLSALQEVKRVLRPGGKAAFIEPLAHNPLIHIYRRMAEKVRTETEAPLSMQDLRAIQRIFPQMEHEEFWFFSLFLFVYFYLVERAHPSQIRYWRKVLAEGERYRWLFRPLKRLDDLTLRVLPFLKRYCWNTVMMCTKDPAPDSRQDSDHLPRPGHR